jgi:hypothetical protein
VLIADTGEGFNDRGTPGNFINMNIGAAVEGTVPAVFWSNLRNRLGGLAYVDKAGKDAAVINAVEAIVYCLQDRTCTDLPFKL